MSTKSIKDRMPAYEYKNIEIVTVDGRRVVKRDGVIVTPKEVHKTRGARRI